MIKYPLPNKVKFNHIKISNSNRGMDLEDDINKSNLFYIAHNQALIYKRPTPIRIVKVDYEHKLITKAFFEKQSTTDYNGLYKTKYIDFEAKSTYEVSLPLNNIKDHQLEHLIRVNDLGGICFFIIRYQKYNETYFYPLDKLLNFLTSTTRKSVSYKEVKDQGILITNNYQCPLDFLKAVDEYYKI